MIDVSAAGAKVGVPVSVAFEEPVQLPSVASEAIVPPERVTVPAPEMPPEPTFNVPAATLSVELATVAMLPAVMTAAESTSER